MLGQLGTARISGQVLDTNGAAVPSARVVVKNKATGQTRETTTSGEGTYTFQNLPPATYEIRVEATNFAQAVVETVTLNVGEVPAINVTVSPAGAQATVVITPADVLNVDTNTSQVAGVINERTLTNLPLNGRNFLDLAFLIPGNAPAANYDPTKTTTIEVSSAGQLGRGGNIAVNGADNNDDVVGGTLQNFPQDASASFRLLPIASGPKLVAQPRPRSISLQKVVRTVSWVRCILLSQQPAVSHTADARPGSSAHCR